MRLLCLQHDPLDGPGTLQDWATLRGHPLSVILVPTIHARGEELPPLDSFDLLVSLGGPMGAYEDEQDPWIPLEKEYLRKALAGGKRILGLCLGCQLMADAFGGKAFRHSCKEFGWQPIEPTPAGRDWFGTGHPFRAFQWHGDTYSLPPGAIQLARNEACEQQAFSLGPGVLGLQFHLEWNEEMAREALAEPGVSPSPSPFVQTPREILSDPEIFREAKARFFALMDRLASV